MKNYVVLLCMWLLHLPAFIYGQAIRVTICKEASHFRLYTNRQPFFIKGMNWDYYPIGTNYTYNFWEQPYNFIKAALDREMRMLSEMGVNTIRLYTGVPAMWIEYIYENYGIYTVLNHSFGRYGIMLPEGWVSHTDYGAPLVRQLLLSEAKALATLYRQTPGLLMYLLGNENNYGLFWQGAATENMPNATQSATAQAAHLYTLFNEAAAAMKAIDRNHPVAICNGDLQFLDIIAKECKDVDVLGVNVYRGISFGDLFQRVKEVYNKPLMLTEFGADAFNAVTGKEDQEYQSKVLVANWQEIYANAAGLQGAGNCLGGFTFQFSDGWWKAGQTHGLDVHDTTASWANGGYENDYRMHANNMNEEWFGICAKGMPDEQGLTTLIPRAAFYALKALHRNDAYAVKKSNKSKKQ